MFWGKLSAQFLSERSFSGWMCFASWKINETCLLCFVVRASRSNLWSQGYSFNFVLMFTRNCRLSKVRPLKSTIPFHLSFLSFKKLRSFVKYWFYSSKINYYVFAPSCYISYVFLLRTIMIEKNDCNFFCKVWSDEIFLWAEFACFMKNKWEREISFCWTSSRV